MSERVEFQLGGSGRKSLAAISGFLGHMSSAGVRVRRCFADCGGTPSLGPSHCGKAALAAAMVTCLSSRSAVRSVLVLGTELLSSSSCCFYSFNLTFSPAGGGFSPLPSVCVGVMVRLPPFCWRWEWKCVKTGSKVLIEQVKTGGVTCPGC